MAWRIGPEYIGWASLAPDANYYAGSTVIVEETRAPLFVFVVGSRFLEPARPAVFVQRAEHPNILKQTKNITQAKVVNNTVINFGPEITHVEKLVNKPVKVVNVHEVHDTEINDYHQDIAKKAPSKAEKLVGTATAISASTKARLDKVRTSTPEVRDHATNAAVPKGQGNEEKKSAEGQEKKKEKPKGTQIDEKKKGQPDKPKSGETEEKKERSLSPQQARRRRRSQRAIPRKNPRVN